MKKFMAVLIAIGFILVSTRFNNIMAEDHGYGDLPPSLPVGDVTS